MFAILFEWEFWVAIWTACAGVFLVVVGRPDKHKTVVALIIIAIASLAITIPVKVYKLRTGKELDDALAQYLLCPFMTDAVGCISPATTINIPQPSPPTSSQPALPDPPRDPPTKYDPMAELMQTQLRDRGCYLAVIDGMWGKRSADALQLFYSAAGITGTATQPTSDAFAVLAHFPKVSCPHFQLG